MYAEERKEKSIITVFLGFLLGLVYFSNNSLIIAISSIQQDLGISTMNINWVVNSYNISIVSILVIAGRICDRLGSARALQYSLPIYVGGSLLILFAQETFVLVLGRFFQGWSLAFLYPCLARVVTGNFQGKELGKAIGLYNGIASIFMPLGFFIGGWICTYGTWRYIYIIDGGWGIILWFLTFFLLKKDSPKKHTKIHIPGFLLFSAGLVCFIAVIMEGKVWGWSSPLSLTLFGGALLFFFLFYLVNRKAKDPLLHFQLFRSPSTIAAFFVMFSVSTVYLISVIWSIYLQAHFFLSPLAAGTLLLLTVVPTVFFSPFIGSLIDRVHIGRLISLGLLLGAAGTGIILLGLNQNHIWILVLGFVVYGNYLIFCRTPTSILLYSSIEPARRGKIFAVYKLWSQIAVLTGFSFLAANMASVEVNLIEERFAEYQITDIPISEARQVTISKEALEKIEAEYPVGTVDLVKKIVQQAGVEGLESTMWVPIYIFLLTFLLFNLYCWKTKSTF
ncbi:MAG: Multidrug resistance protein Stp [Chlamydiae bacterium]|nr:Multidrug resistance protein Stp [Chlamydiota bacterium]